MFKGQIVFLQGWWCVPAGWGRTKHPWLCPIAIELRGITCWNLCEMSMCIYIYMYIPIHIYIYICRIRMSEHLICQIDDQNPCQACQIQSRNIMVSWGDMDAVPDPEEAMSCWRYRFEKNRSRWIPLDSAGWMAGWGIPQSHPIPSWLVEKVWNHLAAENGKEKMKRLEAR